MADLSTDQLIDRIRQDGNVHRDFYRYVSATDPAMIAILGETAKRAHISNEMNNNPTQYRTWVDTWLDEYNQNGRTRDRRMNYVKGAGIGLLGLVLLGAGTQIDDQSARNLVETVGALTTVLGGGGTALYGRIRYRPI